MRSADGARVVGATRPLTPAVAAHHQQGDVVLGAALDQPEQVVAQLLGVEVVAALDRADEPLEALVQRYAAALDEAVGVDEQRGRPAPAATEWSARSVAVVEAEQQVGRPSRAAAPAPSALDAAPAAGARRSTSAAGRARRPSPRRCSSLGQHARWR